MHLPVEPRLPLYARYAKRAVDLLVVCVFLIPFTVFLLINGCYYLLHGGGHPLVSEPRVGQKGAFAFYKLRIRDRGENPTRLGEFLRRWGIDEIGQILNILRGDMSLVGPRPVTLKEHDYYMEREPNFALRYAVRPGLLGLGIGTVTNHLCIEGDLKDVGLLRLQHDLIYVRQWTPYIELKAMGVSLVDMIHGHDPS